MDKEQSDLHHRLFPNAPLLLEQERKISDESALGYLQTKIWNTLVDRGFQCLHLEFLTDIPFLDVLITYLSEDLKIEAFSSIELEGHTLYAFTYNYLGVKIYLIPVIEDSAFKTFQ